MTEDEQKAIYGETDQKNIVAITKLRTREGEEAQGYGRWSKDKEPYGTDKGNSKANMAFIRSERNAFGRLFTDAIPQGVEVIDEAYVDVPDVGKVVESTGEIIEEIEETTQPSPKPTESISEPTQEEKGRIDRVWLEETLKTIHWKEETAISWIKAQCKVELEGSLLDICNQLGKEDLKKFSDHILSMADVA
tara:strand:- start:196 stop:771 length:576 start_codon:yes stop_codon:yes gene_type:complete